MTPLRPNQNDPKKRYQAYLQSELEGAALYESLANVERDTERAAVFHELAQAELRHAARWAERLGIPSETLRPRKSIRTLLLTCIGRFLSTRRLLPLMLRGEATEYRIYARDPEAKDLAQEEQGHAQTLRTLAGTYDTKDLLRPVGWQHISSTSGTLRAAVLGVNDGLVSNFSLVMGIAGGTDNPNFVLLAGVAGILAGSFSMAAGEYVSMRAQRDVYERQLEKAAQELEESPEEEKDGLVLIYRAKGLTQEEAEGLADRIMRNPKVALETMAREELGIIPSQLGSPWAASFSSFIAFALGALVPILPYMVGVRTDAFFPSIVLSSAALMAVGALLAIVSGKRMWWGSMRMLLAGGLAATVTFGIGSLVGVTLGG